MWLFPEVRMFEVDISWREAYSNVFVQSFTQSVSVCVFCFFLEETRNILKVQCVGFSVIYR